MEQSRIKFRVWVKPEQKFYFLDVNTLLYETFSKWGLEDLDIQYLSGLQDKNGKEIYEGDVLEFSDRLVWYQSKYWVHMQFAKDNDELQKLKDKLAAESLERREVKIPDCYEEFSKADLNSYWEVIGNIFENPELLERKTNNNNVNNPS